MKLVLATRESKISLSEPSDLAAHPDRRNVSGPQFPYKFCIFGFGPGQDRVHIGFQVQFSLQRQCFVDWAQNRTATYPMPLEVSRVKDVGQRNWHTPLGRQRDIVPDIGSSSRSINI